MHDIVYLLQLNKEEICMNDIWINKVSVHHEKKKR